MSTYNISIKQLGQKGINGCEWKENGKMEQGKCKMRESTPLKLSPDLHNLLRELKNN